MYFAVPHGVLNAGASYIIYGKQTVMADLGSDWKSASFIAATGLRVTVAVSKGGDLRLNNITP